MGENSELSRKGSHGRMPSSRAKLDAIRLFGGYHKMWLRTSEAQWVKTLSAKLDSLGLILVAHIEERTDSHVLPSQHL